MFRLSATRASATISRVRRAFVLPMLAGSIVIVMILLSAFGYQVITGLKEVAFLVDDAQHFYIAEGLIAGELNLVKKLGWAERRHMRVPREYKRTYKDGPFKDAEVFVRVQDLVDPTLAEVNEKTKVVPNVVDILVKVRRRGSTKSYVERLRMRLPSEPRPTQANVRRFARVAEDVENEQGRKIVLARLYQEERLRERNRPWTNVQTRLALAMLRKGVPLATVADTLPERPTTVIARRTLPAGSFADRLAREFRPGAVWAGINQDEERRELKRPRSAAAVNGAAAGQAALPSGTQMSPADMEAMIQAAVADADAERKILALTRDGDRILFGGLADASGFPAPRNDAQLAQAVTDYEDAHKLAVTQSRANQLQTAPRCLYRLALAKIAQAEGQKFDEITEAGAVATARGNRTKLLCEAQCLFAEIVERFPNSPDAPHGFVPRAWAEVKKARVIRANAWNAARLRAYAILEELRGRAPAGGASGGGAGCSCSRRGGVSDTKRRTGIGYPNYYLWDEKAVTARPGSITVQAPPAPPAPPEDEVVHFEESRIKPIEVVFVDARATSSVGSSLDAAGRIITVDSVYGEIRIRNCEPDETRVEEFRQVLLGSDLTRGDGSLSPDGTSVLLTQFLPQLDWSQIVEVDLSGTRIRKVTDARRSHRSPRFSPDGSRICGVYSLVHDSFGGRRLATFVQITRGQGIFVMDQDGSNFRVLASDPFADDDVSSPVAGNAFVPERPRWSPDGDWILYLKNAQACKRRTDGSGEEVLLSPASTWAIDAMWSLDGTAVAYLSTKEYHDPINWWIVKADGSNPRLVGDTDIQRASCGGTMKILGQEFLGPPNY